MKYLAIASFKDVMLNLPQKEIQRLLEGMVAHMEQHRKSDRIQEGYFIPGWNRLVAISENSSIEELYRNMSENPMYGLLNIEVYPLADIGESMKITLEGLKRSMAAAK